MSNREQGPASDTTLRVFVAGATGVLGKRVVTRLVTAGHQVTAVSRTAEKDELLESLGATPVRVDLFDADAVRTAVAGHDAVVNVATKIPAVAHMARADAWAENERIRRVASTHLVDAALAAHATVFVQESLAFLYGDHGDAWIDAASTPNLASGLNGAVAAAEANVDRFRAEGGRGVVLRFGHFYAPDSDQAAAMVQAARRGVVLDAGTSDSYVPMIDADDAATAVVAALAAPAGIYDIVDQPLTRAEQSEAMAAAVGRRRLWRAPKWVVPKTASYLVASQRVSNQAFRDATGWRPRSVDVRGGFSKLVRALRIEPVLPLRVRLSLWILAFTAFGVGAQAEFFPRSFYDDFPIGRGWVAMDGRYNEHLIRDVGALNLALLVLTIGAIVVGTRAVTRITAASWFVYSAPHLLYHLRHLTMNMSGVDKAAMIGSLSVPVIASIVMFFDRAEVPAASIDARETLREAGGAPNLTRVSVRR